MDATLLNSVLFLFPWSWLIPRVSRDFIDCDEFKWQRLLLDLFNRFVRTAMTKQYRQYRCSQRWCSIDIWQFKSLFFFSFFFFAYFTREVDNVCYANSTINLAQSQSLGLIISGGQSVRMRHRSELTERHWENAVKEPSLRKQLIIRDGTAGFPAKIRRRNDCRYRSRAGLQFSF